MLDSLRGRLGYQTDSDSWSAEAIGTCAILYVLYFLCFGRLEYLNEAYRRAGMGGTFFIRACSNRMTGNSFNLEDGRFRVDNLQLVITN